MKREGIKHTKILALARDLGIEDYGAVGIVESLKHLAAIEAPRGDIGKLSNEDIALWIGWRARPADDLIAALVRRGFLDERDDYRLVIHDWWEHAEASTHMKLARAGLCFADGKRPCLTRFEKKGERARIEALYAQAPPTTSARQVPDERTESAREPEVATSGEPDEPPILTYSTVGNGPPMWGLTASQVRKWAALYPGLNVMNECRKALAWLDSQPSRRKTARGMPRFLVGWLNKATNSSGGGGGVRRISAPAFNPSLEGMVYDPIRAATFTENDRDSWLEIFDADGLHDLSDAARACPLPELSGLIEEWKSRTRKETA